MPQQLLIAIGAGLASALLFFIPVKGTPFAMSIALFASLPLMIAGLAFSPASALFGAVAGSLGLLFGLLVFTEVGFAQSAIFSLFFAATAALPAWWLTRLAWLGRPPEPHETPAPDGLVWYPIGRLLAWMAALGAAAAIAGVLAAVARWGSFDAFMTESTRRIIPMIEAMFDMRSGGESALPAGMTAQELARTFIMATAPVMAGWTVAGLALNLWLAGRIALVSGSLRRPWLDVPENFDPPGSMVPIFAAALVLTLIDGLPRLLGATIASAIGAVFALKGLASLHAGTRKSAMRGLILGAVYMTMLILFPLPLPLLAALGLAAILSVRNRRPPAPPANTNIDTR